MSDENDHFYLIFGGQSLAETCLQEELAGNLEMRNHCQTEPGEDPGCQAADGLRLSEDLHCLAGQHFVGDGRDDLTTQFTVSQFCNKRTQILVRDELTN